TDYRFDMAAAIQYGDYILFACRHRSSTVNNTVFAYDKKHGSLDLLDYWVSCFAIYNGSLIAGDSLTGNVYTLFSGFDDDDSLIDNYWESGADSVLPTRGAIRNRYKFFNVLKKVHKFVVIGSIGLDKY